MRPLDVLDQLLECAEDLLDPPTCRQFINPGGVAPFDSCERTGSGDSIVDGQVWVGHISSQAGWPTPLGLPMDCATAWTETYQLGVVRCAQGKLQGNGQPPNPTDVTADAEQQELDRLALQTAFMCCLGIDLTDLIVVDWSPVEPQGGCVGGQWTIQIRDGGCPCYGWPES